MKRLNNLFPLIVNKYNIELADTRARKNKKNRYGILKHDKIKDLDKCITGIKLSGWNGVSTNISNFRNKWIYIVNIEIRNKYFIVLFLYNKNPYLVHSSSKKLLTLINKTNIIKL